MAYPERTTSSTKSNRPKLATQSRIACVGCPIDASRSATTSSPLRRLLRLAETGDDPIPWRDDPDACCCSWLDRAHPLEPRCGVRAVPAEGVGLGDWRELGGTERLVNEGASRRVTVAAAWRMLG